MAPKPTKSDINGGTYNERFFFFFFAKRQRMQLDGPDIGSWVEHKVVNYDGIP